MIFIPNTLLVTFFRHIRQRRSSHRVPSLIDTLSKARVDQMSSNTTTTENVERQKKKPKLFPWWCLFIAYGFSYVLIGVSIFLIIARGIEFGDAKTQKWLVSLFVGFLSSVLFFSTCQSEFQLKMCRTETFCNYLFDRL